MSLATSQVAFRASLRIARRDAWRNKGRSLLVVLLVGLPVLAVSVVDIGWRTYQLSPGQMLTRAIGSADLAVQAGGGGPIKQSVKGWLDGGGYSIGNGSTPADQNEQTLLAALPAGSRAISEMSANSPLTIRTPKGVEYAPLISLDYADPIAHGMVDQVSGRAPKTAGEIALTTALSRDTGITVGQHVTTYDGSRSFLVVGIVHDTSNRSDQAMYSLPSKSAPSTGQGSATWLIDTPHPVEWSTVLKLNQLGFVAVSRAAVLNPPPAGQISYSPPPGGASAQAIAATALVAGMALLEIVLLAGPAFAVAARRQRRALALVAATGGRRRDLAAIVLANGLVLGVTAGVLGALGGVGLCAALIALFGNRYDSAYPGPFDARPLELGVIALVSVIAAVLAAMYPAWTASRTDVVAALAGRQGQLRTRRRTPVLGLAGIVTGIVVAVIGSAAGRNIVVILSGVIVAELGLILVIPAIIGLVSRSGGLFPVPVRIALRDAARNRASAAPAIAAVTACMIGAIAVAVVTSSRADLARRDYHPKLPDNVAFVGLSPPSANTVQPAPDRLADVLRGGLATSSAVTLYAPSSEPPCAINPVPGQVCTTTYLSLYRPPNDPSADYATRYAGGDYQNVMADDGGGVAALFGQPNASATAALRSGKAVVTDPQSLHDGLVRISVQSFSLIALPAHNGTGQTAPPPSNRVVSVPAVLVTQGYPGAQVILPTAKVTAITGSAPVPTGVAAVLTHRPTNAERQAVAKSVAALGPDLQLSLEDGFHDSATTQLYALLTAAALLALAGALVATALANADSHNDLVTLGAVGASPRARRLISSARAALIATVGCVIGAAAGFVPALSLIAHTNNATRAAMHAIGSAPDSLQLLHIKVPWPQIAIAVVGIPLLAAITAAVFTPGRLPSESLAGRND